MKSVLHQPLIFLIGIYFLFLAFPANSQSQTNFLTSQEGFQERAELLAYSKKLVIPNPAVAKLLTPPVANDDSYAGTEDITLTVSNPAFGLLSNDSDPDLDNLLVSIVPVTFPTNGTLTLNPDGTFEYIPNPDFSGVDTFVYEVCDDAAFPECSTALVTITFNAVNDAPVPADDVAVPDAIEDTPYNGSTVLANDFDADAGDLLTVITTPIVSPVHGGLTLNSDGTYTYTPQPNYFGLDAFTYRVCDNGTPQLCDVASVEINITGVPDPPAVANDIYFTNEDVTLNGSSVLSNDLDFDSQLLVINTTPITAPLHGSLTITPGTGTFTYIPTLNYNGPDSFVYEVCDDGIPSECSQGTVFITVNVVNDIPIAINDIASTNEDTPLNGSTVLSNDSDPDGNPLTVVTVPVINVTNGSLILNADGTYLYTPNANFTGNDFFVYTVCDNQFPAGCSDATVNITVNSFNDAPSAVNDNYIVNEDISLNGTTVLVNDTDPEGNNLIVNTTPITSVVNGSLTLNANGTFLYTPNLNYNGGDSFVYEVCDDGVPSACSTATVNLTVNAINDAPIAVADVATISEDGVLNGLSVLLNDSDPDGNLLTVSLIPVTPPSNGVLTLNGNGTYTYTPFANYNGPDSFVYQVCDNAGTSLCATAIVNLTITALNDAPIASNDVASTNEDIGLNGSTVLANDVDPDGNPLTVNTVPLVLPLHGTLNLNTNGTYTYTPAPNYNGSDSFVYEVCDNAIPSLCNSATVTITINSIADVPIAANDNYSTAEDALLNAGSVLNNDFDGDGDLLSVNTTPVSNVSNGVLVLNGDGTFIYIPSPNFNGSDSFIYQVCDPGSNCVNATVIISVNSVNDAPVAVNDNASVNEDLVLTGSTVLLNDSDPEGNTLAVNTNAVVTPANGNLVLNANGTYTYTPAANFNGIDSFVYQICDNGIPSACSNATVTITVNAVNDNPTLVNDVFSTNEDVLLVGSSLLINDSDIDGNTISIVTTPVTNPSNGNLVLNVNGTFTYLPNANFNGTDSFVYRVCDNGVPSLCANATVTITVNSVNDLPVAVSDAASTSEDNVLIGSTVLANDSDPDGNPLTVSTLPITAPLNGTLSINSNGTYTYTPAANFNGNDSFVYQVCDNASPAGCANATVSISITAVNDAPLANADSYSTNEDVPLNGSTVLVNDSDVDGNPLTVSTVPVIAPTNGVLTLNINGTFTYVPNANFSGSDSFVYRVCDNGAPALCSNGTVSITVNPVNDAPIAVSGTYSTSEDVTLLGSTVLANDSDPDGNALTVITTPVVNVSSGALTLNSDGTFIYVPNANFNGTVSFVYQVCDNAIPSLCSTATTTIDVISVNDAPLAVADNYSTNEDTPLNGSSVLVNDSDVEGNALTLNTTPFSSPTHGILVLNPNGTFTYTPDANYFGSDSFTYQVCDNGTPSLCANATVTINIQSVNDLPIATDDNGSTLENIVLNGTTVLANDFDPEGGILTVNTTPLTNVAHGVLVLNSNGTYTYTPNLNYNGFDFFVYQVCDNGSPQVCASATVTISIGSVNQFPIAVNDVLTTNEDTPNSSNVLTNDSDPDLDQLFVTPQTNFPTAHGNITIAANGAYTYTPNLNYNGPDNFSYQVCDNGSPTLCSNGTLNINVLAVNDAPVAVNDNVSTPEDTPLNGTSLLSNDSDVDGNPLTLSAVPLVAPTHGTLQLNSNGTYIYTPNLNYTGGDTFVYEVCDNAVPPSCSNAVVLITVNPVNDAPAAVNDSYTTNEDVVLNGSSVLVNDFDQDGNALQVTGIAITPPTHGNLVINANGTFIYTPTLNFNGTDNFVYQVCDNAIPSLCSNATVTITINSINDAPVAVNDAASTSEDTPLNGANLLLNDIDVDGNPLTINTSPAISPANGTVVINSNGTYVYTPAANFNGTDSFTYQVCDNGVPVLCGTATVSITVTSANDSPIAVADIAATNEDIPLNGTTVLSNDTDPDGNPLVVNTTPLIAPLNGTLNLNANGTYAYVPALNYNGTDSFTYQVCDNGIPALCSSTTVTININPVNDAPLAVNDAFIVTEDTPLIGTSLLLNDSDPESGLLVISTIPVTNPTKGVVSINANGTFVYTPNPNFNGSDSFVYQVCDAGIPVACSNATVTLTITAVNDAPIAIDDNASTLEDITLNGGSLILNDSDPDGNIISINTSPIVNTSNGTLVINSNGTYTYTPNPGFSGFDSFEYQVCDNGTPVLCDNAIVTIGIGAVNHAPIATADAYTTNENIAISNSLSTNDVDSDGNNLIYSTIPVVAPANGLVTISANGNFTYTPNAGFSGSDNFVYQVCDDGAPILCATANVSITINPVNDKPSVNADIAVINEDTQLNNLSLLSNDTDPDGNNLTVTLTPVDAPQNGIVVLNANGTFTYTPNVNFNGTDSFVYQACDNGNPSLCDTAIVNITILPVNDAPLAVNDAAATLESTAVSGNIISNDSDVDGVNLTTSILTNVVNGNMTLNSNGAFTYTPFAAFTGNDTLVYLLCDGASPALCDTANLVITVSLVPNSPPFANFDTYTLNEDDTLNSASILINDIDPNLNTIVLNTNPVSGPSNGSVTINTDGTLVYIPNSNFSGTDQFVYSICDDGSPSLCDTAIVLITVIPLNDAPVAVNDTVQTLVNTVINGNVLLNDSDVDGPVSTISLLNLPVNGSVVLNPNGTFAYTPSSGFTGSDSFDYTYCDGGSPDLCAVATVVITVNALPPNQAPVALGDFEITNEDVQISGNLSQNDTDPENSSLVYTIYNGPTANGNLAISASGNFIYIPSANYFGSDSFVYTVCDTATPALCDTAILTIQINPINDAPVALNDSATILQGTIASGNLLSNDNDVETAVLISSLLVLPINGNAVINANGTYSYTPNASFVGTDIFSYLSCDSGIPSLCDTALVVVTVVAPPCAGYEANADNTFTIEDAQVIISPLSNDIFASGNVLVGITQNPANGTIQLNANNTITYIPNLNFNGTDSFAYSIGRNTGGPSLCDTALVVITISSINDAPVAVDDTLITSLGVAVSGNVILNDVDVDDPLLTTTLVVNPANGTLLFNIDGTFTYTPNAGFLGIDTFSYSVCDGGSPALCDTAIVTITVTGQLCAGYTANSDNAILNEDDSLDIFVLTNDTVVLANVGINIIQAPANGTLSLNFNNSITYIPNSNYFGSDSFVYALVDLSLPNPFACDTAIVTIVVLPVNDSPIANADNFSMNEGQSLLDTLVLNDSDIDSDSLVVSLVTAPINGSLNISGNGTFVYTPTLNFVGIDSFVYLLCDTGSTSLCDTAFVRIRVLKVNKAPFAVDDTASLNQGDFVVRNVLLNDSDPDQDDFITATQVTQNSAHGSVSLASDGNFIYTPDELYFGLDSFAYRVCDDNALNKLCDEAMVRITIRETPFSVPDAFSPDGDNINDFFVIKQIKAYPNSEFKVFNRWGHLVYRKKGYDNTWNGRSNVGAEGDGLPSGSYFYTLEFNDGLTKTIQGYIVIRK